MKYFLKINLKGKTFLNLYFFLKVILFLYKDLIKKEK